MRQSKREMPAEWAWTVIDKAPFVTVAFIRSNGVPYSVPLSLARVDNTLYFHCANEGEKIDCIKQNPHVAISAVAKCQPTIYPNDATRFTLDYESAMAIGIAEIVTDEVEKELALHAICRRFLPNNMHNFKAAIEKSLNRTTVVRITLDSAPIGKCKIAEKQ